MKQFFLFMVGFIGMNTMHAQTDEAFLAEVFFGGMTKKDSNVYLVKECRMSAISPLIQLIDVDYKIFREAFGISDTTVVNELHEYRNQATQHQEWNPNDAAFQSSNYKSLKFVNQVEAHKLDVKNKNVKYIDKPLYTKNGEYALVSVAGITCHKYGWKYRLTVKPWKNIWKPKYECDVASYNLLYKKENGKWELVGTQIKKIS